MLEGLKDKGLPTQILEFGAGTGKLAASILARLNDLRFSLGRYDIIEISPDLAQRQQERINATVKQLHLKTQCNWLSELPNNFRGIILANEVIDTIPCEAIIFKDGFGIGMGLLLRMKLQPGK